MVKFICLSINIQRNTTRLRFKKAFPYFQKSAIGGLPHGQVAVAYYYQFGAGDMAIDYVVAQSWLDKGVEQGFALAKARREILQNQIAQPNSQSVAQATA